jgi:putative membrane protein
MTIEGVREFEALRDFLYARMRGTKLSADPAPGRESGAALAPHVSADLARTLREVTLELRALRLALKREPAERPDE